jgi:hypothetical protein
MTFDAFETTDGRPVEFITFINGLQEWRITNANRAVSPGATPFEPLAYKRSSPSNSKNTDDSQIKMTLPGDFPVVQLYTNILTSNVTSVTIERRHENDPDGQLQVFWKGTIASATRRNAIGELLIRPLTSGGHEIPRFTYQSACNYFLYDGSTCRLARNDFEYATVLDGTDVTGTILTFNGLRARAATLDAGVTGSSTSGELDEYWLNGFLLTAAGELRRVAEANVGADPDAIRIPWAFLDLQVSDGVSIFAGCSRSADVCVRKFDNIINFGGFNNVPVVNPMATELPAGVASDEKKGFY